MIEMVILHFGRNGIGEGLVKGTKVIMFVTVQNHEQLLMFIFLFDLN